MAGLPGVKGGQRSDAARIRLDKWLWQARFHRTRTLAAGAVTEGLVRLNGVRTLKPGHAVVPGDTLTLLLPDGIRVVRILACGNRRGPAAEARQLYSDVNAEPDSALMSPLE